MKIIFVLPNSYRSGGVKATVEMANQLLLIDHEVWIAVPSIPLSFKPLVKRIFKFFSKIFCRVSSDTWIHKFKGGIKYYKNLDDLPLDRSDIVIAVGSFAVKGVYNLKKDVIKVRYCHGFSDYLPDLMEFSWGVPMATIAVSQPLVPRLETYSGQKVFGVVRNGIDTEEYFNENLKRDGIGAIFSHDPKKLPEDMLKLLKCINDRWPSLKRYIFGADKRPKELPKSAYRRLPSVDKARELYNRSKIWLLTSRNEGFPFSILEAMACGCAVISTNYESASDLIDHGQNGILVPIGDIDAFMDNIDMLLKDESKRKSIVEKGFETINRLTWDKAAREMEKVLEIIKKNNIRD